MASLVTEVLEVQKLVLGVPMLSLLLEQLSSSRPFFLVVAALEFLTLVQIEFWVLWVVSMLFLSDHSRASIYWSRLSCSELGLPRYIASIEACC